MYEYYDLVILNYSYLEQHGTSVSTHSILKYVSFCQPLPPAQTLNGNPKKGSVEIVTTYLVLTDSKFTTENGRKFSKSISRFLSF